MLVKVNSSERRKQDKGNERERKRNAQQNHTLSGNNK